MNLLEARRRIEEVMRLRCPRVKETKRIDTTTKEGQGELSLPQIKIKTVTQKKQEPWEYLKGRVTETSIDLAFVVPAGYSTQDLRQETDALFATLGRYVTIQDRAGVVVVTVSRKDFPTSVKFTPEMLQLTQGREVLVGFDRAGRPIVHNFRVPHVLIGAQSGYGKTEMLRLWLYQLINRFTPEQLHIDIIDGKGFSYKAFRGVPHVRRIARDLAGAYAILKDNRELMDRRSAQVWEEDDSDGELTFSWRLTVIDEMYVISPAGQVTKEAKQLAIAAYAHMAAISCVGREASVGVIMATQRPDVETVHPQVKQNCDVSIAFRCKTESNSKIILDRSGAEDLPHNVPGRGIYSGMEDAVFQAPYYGGRAAWNELLKPYRKEREHADDVDAERDDTTSDISADDF